MEEKEFVALVDRLEDSSHRNPGAYKLRVALLLADHVSFPGFTFIIALEERYKPLRAIFERIQGAEIYRAA
jgi:hypothetical protein